MKFYNSIEEYNENENTVVTLGKFDGLHRGHQKLIKKVNELTNGELKSLLVAFDMRCYKKGLGFEAQEIMVLEEKKSYLKDKVDYFIQAPFTESLRHTTAKDYVRDVIVKRFQAKHVVVGQGFQFGRGGEGNIAILREMGNEYGFQVHVVDKLSYGFETISSTYARMEIKQGRMEIVSDLLDYNYSFEGLVQHGAKLGRTIGFPTLNIKVPDKKVMPPRGVYICKIYIDGKQYYGMGNIGCKPTVTDERVDLLEVHVLDYNEDTYGKLVKVEFLKYLRMEQKFRGVDELMNQIEIDLGETKRYISILAK